jgi:hypothetical protein
MVIKQKERGCIDGHDVGLKEAPDNRYERMTITMYLYRAGAIDFLDLLNRFEEILKERTASSQ